MALLTDCRVVDYGHCQQPSSFTDRDEGPSPLVAQLSPHEVVGVSHCLHTVSSYRDLGSSPHLVQLSLYNKSGCRHCLEDFVLTDTYSSSSPVLAQRSLYKVVGHGNRLHTSSSTMK